MAQVRSTKQTTGSILDGAVGEGEAMNQINLRDDYIIGVGPNAAQDGTWLLQMHTEDGETTQIRIHRKILDTLAIDIIHKTTRYDEIEGQRNE